MKAYSYDLRERVISLSKTNNYSISEIAHLFNLSYATSHRWITRFRKTGKFENLRQYNKGAERRFDDKESVLLFLKENPDANGIEIRDVLMPDLPMSTMYDSLKRMKITLKKKKVFILNEMK